MAETTKKAAKQTTAEKAAEAEIRPVSAVAESTYTLAEFVANPGVLEATPDIVRAALVEGGKKEYTISDAKKIVKEFKERKVL